MTGPSRPPVETTGTSIVSYTRRRFISTAAVATAAIPLVSSVGTAQPRSPTIVSGARRRDADVHDLAAQAVEAARAAGAAYADVRLTRIMNERYMNSSYAGQTEEFGVGVRALVNGYWGFYSSAVWTPDEVVRLAQGAVEQAKANGAGRPRTAELVPMQQVSGGQWRMPVKYDPFDVPVEEKLDVMRAVDDYVRRYMVGVQGGFGMSFARTEKVFASTEGSSWEQTLYESSAGYSVSYRGQYSLGLRTGGSSADFMSLAGKGWEHISESGLIDEIPRLVEQAEQARHRTPVDIGRYEAVFTPSAAASFINSTLGPATQLDRAMGFDAGAEGVSFITPPLEQLGELALAPSVFTLTANRSQPGGAATVKWDDEGVEPDEFTIIKNGVVNDFQTTRERATWLKPWYDKQGIALRSHGCAGSESGETLTSQRLPNLMIAPDPNGQAIEAMIADVKKGVLVESLGRIVVDQQLLNGMGYGAFREIVNGKLGRYITGAGLSFRTPNLLKVLEQVGPANSLQWFGFSQRGGQPSQRTPNSVGAVPLRFKQVDIIDLMRKG